MDVMFVVPAFGRAAVSRVAFAALAWTMRELAELGLVGGAVVVADDENLGIAAGHGFDTLDRPNERGEKLNDGIEHAARQGAEFVVYVGSDDLVDPAHVAAQIRAHRGLGPAREHTVVASRTSSVVSPDGRQIVHLRIPYACGDGVSLRPLSILKRVGYRPVPAGVNRAMDGAVWTALRRSGPLRFEYVDAAPCQITDLKTAEVQVTSFAAILDSGYVDADSDDPWGELASVYPRWIVDAAAGIYAGEAVAA